jgi:hypothetical protein
MKEEIIAVIVVLFLLLISCFCFLGPNWKIGPRVEYHKIVTRFGTPSSVNPSSNGVAVWKRFDVKCPFIRLMIVDENVPHNTHCDFIYTTINYYIDPKKLMDVLAVSDSIMYDKLKQELTVRCDSLETTMATLVLADGVHGDILTNNNETYKKYITNAKKDSVSNYRVLQDIKEKYELRYADFGRCSQ